MTQLVDFVHEPQWCAWRNEKRADSDKLTKIPYCDQGRQAKADTPDTWRQHDAAAELVKSIVNGMDGGIGFFLGQCAEKYWNIGIDLDTCRNPDTGAIEPWAREVLDRLDTYSEVSPSRTGVKCFLQCDPANIEALRAVLGRKHGRSWKGANGQDHPPAIEVHVSHRYFAVTWDALDDFPSDLRWVTLDDIKWLVEEAGPALAGKPNSPGNSEGISEPHQSGTSSDILFRLDTAAQHNRALATALLHASTMRGGSRSEGPFGLGAALRRAGWSFHDMKAALLACPATKEWTNERQSTEGDRWANRIWENGAPSDNREQRSSDNTSRPSGAEKPERGQVHGRLLVLGMADIDTAPPRDYFLKGLISPGEISIWVGAPKCGKSFLLLHVGYLLSIGRSVFQRRVKPTKTLYVAAEGEAGITKRIRALRDKYGPSENFHFIAQPIDLLRDGGHRTEIIDAAIAVGAKFIIIDTLNRALAGGDENSAEDMGAFICNVADIRYQTGCHIAIVHHGTKASDGRSPRGHGSLEGADDALIDVVKQPDGSRIATVVHAKDDADGMTWGFNLEIVEMGIDEDGDPVTTLIVQENAGIPERAEKAPAVSAGEQIALLCLEKAFKAHGTVATVGPDFTERPVVAEMNWRQQYYSEAKPGADQDAKRQAYGRAVQGLQAKRIIASQDGFVWRPDTW